MARNTTTYSLTNSLWPDEGLLHVVDSQGNRVLGISIRFMRVGRVLNWAYVQEAASQCVVERGCICHLDGRAINDDTPLKVGAYLYLREGK